ncbi:hypothetical protein TNCV_706001 [Trichonephila clavipes]|nr:hypothetical protein TNCV_706001 [Trichonephila clavipes]
MEDDTVFAIILSLYEREAADLGDYINVMMFRSHLNTMKPSEVFVLESTVDLVEKIQQLFPNLDLRELPSFEHFAYLEPGNSGLFPLLPGTGGQQRKGSLYPSRIDCDWQIQTV